MSHLLKTCNVSFSWFNGSANSYVNMAGVMFISGVLCYLLQIVKYLNLFEELILCVV